MELKYKISAGTHSDLSWQCGATDFTLDIKDLSPFNARMLIILMATKYKSSLKRNKFIYTIDDLCELFGKPKTESSRFQMEVIIRNEISLFSCLSLRYIRKTPKRERGCGWSNIIKYQKWYVNQQFIEFTMNETSLPLFSNIPLQDIINAVVAESDLTESQANELVNRVNANVY